MNIFTLFPARVWLFLLPLLMVDAPRALGQGGTPEIRLARQQAIALAIANNIDLRVRALDSALAEANIQTSRSIYDPLLSSSLDYSRTSLAGETYGTETTAGSLALSQRLSTGGTVTLTTRTGPTSAVSDPLYDYTDWSSSVGLTIYQPLLKNAGKQATELGIIQDKYAHAQSLQYFRNMVIDTVFSVITEYNRLYVLRQLLESRQAAVQSALQLIEELKTRPGPDDNPEVELANAEYALSQRQTDLIEAERQVSNKEADLRYLVGIEEKVHLIPTVPPSRAEPPETEQEAIDLALAEHPDLKALRLQLESNQIREKVSQRNLRPDLALTASGGYRGYAADGGFGDTISQIGEGRGEYWSAGMRLSIPLGNDLAQGEHRRNALRSEQLENQLTAKAWKIRDTIREDNRSLISARLQVRSTAKSKALAEARVAQYQKNRRRGKSSVKDLLDAENDLINARNRELNAIENFSYLVTRLWKDIGVLLERQNINVATDQPAQLTAGSLPVDSALGIAAPGPVDETAEEPPPPRPAESLATTSPPPAQSAAAPQPAAAARAKPASTYTLKIGHVLASELPRFRALLERNRLTPVVSEGPREERDVVRLSIGTYPTLAAAQKTLERLPASSGGFILRNEQGGYDAFAGSFFSREDALSGQQQLAARGIGVTLREVKVALPTHLVTAGSFSTRASALETAEMLEKQGLSPEVLGDTR